MLPSLGFVLQILSFPSFSPSQSIVHWKLHFGGTARQYAGKKSWSMWKRSTKTSGGERRNKVLAHFVLEKMSTGPYSSFGFIWMKNNFRFQAEKKANKPTNPCGFATTLFLTISKGNPNSQLLLPSLEQIRTTLPRNASEDSSVLGTSRLKSPKPTLSSHLFLNSVLEPRWTVSFSCWKGLWLPFSLPPLCSHLFWWRAHLMGEENSPALSQYTLQLLQLWIKTENHDCFNAT